MLKIQLFIVLVSTTLTLLGATSPTSAQVGASVNANIDVNKVYGDITNGIRSLKNRDACVKGASEIAYSAVNQRYNVIVFNLSNDYSANLPGAVFKQIQCAGLEFGVWIFQEGTFINKGDGGFINWAFQGNFKRTGNDNKTVIFPRP